MANIFVCRDGELKDGAMRLVSAGDLSIGVYRHGGKYYAYRNFCVHQGGPACEGLMVPKVVDVVDDRQQYVQQAFDESEMHIVCPWHGWEYKLTTGECAHHASFRLTAYDVTERDGSVYVEV